MAPTLIREHPPEADKAILPKPRRSPSITPADRFWSKVTTAGPLDCWVWTGRLDRAGYGSFWTGTRYIGAHRWSYEYMRAAIPPHLVIDHECSNPACVNPWHLDAVTPGENTRRTVRRGRHGGPAPRSAPFPLPPQPKPAGLTDWEHVAAGIRARIATASSGDRLPSIAELSAEYDVGATTVKMAVAHLRASGEIRTKRGQGTFVP